MSSDQSVTENRRSQPPAASVVYTGCCVHPSVNAATNHQHCVIDTEQRAFPFVNTAANQQNSVIATEQRAFPLVNAATKHRVTRKLVCAFLSICCNKSPAFFILYRL